MRKAHLAWGLCGLSVMMFAGALAFQLFTLDEPVGGVFGSRGLTTLPGAVFVLLGALLATRQPRNSIGWMLLAAGFVAAVQQLAREYATYGLLTGRSELVSPTTAGWISNWSWVPLVALMGVFVILYFPDGHLPSKAWRHIARAATVAVILATVGSMIDPGPMDSGVVVLNPYAVEHPPWLAELVLNGGLMLLNLGIVGGFASLVVRFRRTSGIERAQIKWLALGAGSLAAVLLLSTPVFLTQTTESLAYRILANATIIALGALPIAIAIAILRYQLYDIDRIISRTIVYGVLTSLLAAGYIVVVLIIRSLLPVADDSPLVVATSTLAMVALFRPLRARLQTIVDRRFNRAGYDAALTVERFGSRLRSEVDLDEITTDLVAVARQTLQPAHVSLWLRGSEERT